MSKYKITSSITSNEVGDHEVELVYPNGFFRRLLRLPESKEVYVSRGCGDAWIEKGTFKRASLWKEVEINNALECNRQQADKEVRRGVTKTQMMNAKKDAVYVWWCSDVSHAKRLANSLGREDLEIVTKSYANLDFWQGRKVSEVVFDHAVKLTNKQFSQWQRVIALII